jgi:PilZ domain
MGVPSQGSPRSSGSALLVSSDPAAIEVLTICLEQLAIVPQVCVDIATAMRFLSRRKFEAVIVDFLIGDAAKAFLEEVRASAANKTAVTLAIIGTHPQVQTDTYFMLARPLSSASVTQTLRAAYPLIVRERRRNFRCPVTVPVIMYWQDTQFRCETVNISEGGLAVKTSEALHPGALFRAQFVLPGLVSSSNAQCEVCWYNDQGLGGLRFVNLPVDQLAELQGWLALRLEENLPKSGAPSFGNGI